MVTDDATSASSCPHSVSAKHTPITHCKVSRQPSNAHTQMWWLPCHHLSSNWVPAANHSWPGTTGCLTRVLSISAGPIHVGPKIPALVLSRCQGWSDPDPPISCLGWPQLPLVQRTNMRTRRLCIGYVVEPKCEDLGMLPEFLFLLLPSLCRGLWGWKPPYSYTLGRLRLCLKHLEKLSLLVPLHQHFI